ncbi:MAG: type II secretion system protein GspG [Solirubrobacterales bacterium]
MNKSRIFSTEANARLLQTCVTYFREDFGRLPTREEELNVLIQKPLDWPTAVEWTSFLETTDLPRDGWGHDFVYVFDSNLPRGFGIYSCGQDGVTASAGNDRDDINTWNDQTPWRTYYKLSAIVTDRRLAFVVIGLILATGILILVKRSASSRQPTQ